MLQTEFIKVQLSGSHYQPKGCGTAFVIGIYWDLENKRPCVQLLYKGGETDYIPLSELGSSHVLGSVTIINRL